VAEDDSLRIKPAWSIVHELVEEARRIMRIAGSA